MNVISTEFSVNLKYHLDNNIPIHENIFRYGSEAWSNLICEARLLYDQGLVSELDIEEFQLLESDAGIKAEYEGNIVLLDTPEVNWDRPGWKYVYVRDNDSVKRIEFED